MMSCLKNKKDLFDQFYLQIELFKRNYFPMYNVLEYEEDLPSIKEANSQDISECMRNPGIVCDFRNICDQCSTKDAFIQDGPVLECIPFLQPVNTTIIPQSLLFINKMKFDSIETSTSSAKCLLQLEEFVDVLATIDQLNQLGQIMHTSPTKICYIYAENSNNENVIFPIFTTSIESIPESATVIKGTTVNVDDNSVFIPGNEIINKTGTKIFIPGLYQNWNGGINFIPGICIQRSELQYQFIPGVFLESHKICSFVAGQYFSCDGELHFRKGQVIHTYSGSMFVPGETILTPCGIRFIPGVEIASQFICGLLISNDNENDVFLLGQTVGGITKEMPVSFVPGRTNSDSNTFVPGYTSLNFVFQPGQIIRQIDGSIIFLHGILAKIESSLYTFIPDKSFSRYELEENEARISSKYNQKHWPSIDKVSLEDDLTTTLSLKTHKTLNELEDSSIEKINLDKLKTASVCRQSVLIAIDKFTLLKLINTFFTPNKIYHSTAITYKCIYEPEKNINEKNIKTDQTSNRQFDAQEHCHTKNKDTNQNDVCEKQSHVDGSKKNSKWTKSDMSDETLLNINLCKNSIVSQDEKKVLNNDENKFNLLLVDLIECMCSFNNINLQDIKNFINLVLSEVSTHKKLDSDNWSFGSHVTDIKDTLLLFSPFTKTNFQIIHFTAIIVIYCIENYIKQNKECRIDVDLSELCSNMQSFIQAVIIELCQDFKIPTTDVRFDSIISHLMTHIKSFNYNVTKKLENITIKVMNYQFMANIRKDLVCNIELDVSIIREKFLAILSSSDVLAQSFKNITLNNPRLLKSVLSYLATEECDSEELSTLETLEYAITMGTNDFYKSLVKDCLNATSSYDSHNLSNFTNALQKLSRFLEINDLNEKLNIFLMNPSNIVESVQEEFPIFNLLKQVFVIRDVEPELFIKLNNSSLIDNNKMNKIVEKSNILLGYKKKPPPTSEELVCSSELDIHKYTSIYSISSQNISMSTFQKMKINSENEIDGTYWLKKILSSTDFEIIPVECSRILVILKDGLQAIVPRGASRKIINNTDSYTLIDNTGMSFYISSSHKFITIPGVKEATKSNTFQYCDQKAYEYAASPHYESLVSIKNKISYKDEGESTFEQRAQENQLKMKNNKNLLRKTHSESECNSKDSLRSKWLNYNYEINPHGPLYNIDMEIKPEDEDMASLEKYRPHNYHCDYPTFSHAFNMDSTFGEQCEINQLRDFYCKMGKRQACVSNPQINNISEFSKEKPKNLNGICHNKKYTHLMDTQSENFFQTPSKTTDKSNISNEGLNNIGSDQYVDIDETTKLLLLKAQNIRSSVPSWNSSLTLKEKNLRHASTNNHESWNKIEQGDANSFAFEDFASSPNILKKIKTSTNNLMDTINNNEHSKSLTQQTSQGRYNGKNESRFLRTFQSDTESELTDSIESKIHASSAYTLADEILGIRPKQTEHCSNGGFMDNFQSSLRSSEYSKNAYQGRIKEDEDLDEMILSLKHKTRGRDMRSVIKEMEKLDINVIDN